MKSFLVAWRGPLMWAGVFAFCVNMLYLTFPIYMLVIYDRVLASFSVPTLLVVTVGAIIALITLGLLEWVKSRLLVWISVSMDEYLGRSVFFKTLQDATDPEKGNSDRSLKDVLILRDYFTAGPVLVLFDLLWTPVFIGIIFIMHPYLGVIAIIGAVGIIVFGVLQELLTRERYEMARALGDEAGNFYEVCVRNAEAVTAMGMIDALSSVFERKDRPAQALQFKASDYGALFTAMAKSWRTLLQVLIYGMGAYLTITNRSTAGIMIAASITMGRALAPVEQLMATWRQTVEARGAHARLQKLLESTEEPEHMDVPDFRGSVEVQGVSLTVQKRNVLQNVSFALEPGEICAVIGPSGAGKSSLCRVILGVWRPTSGRVTLDGVEVALRNREFFNREVGYLPQDVQLFPGTVAENIARMGEVNPEAVVEAAKLVGIHEMILSLPQGYDTQVGYGGVIFSGGQRQRVGLARAFYRLPRLVVLDEPNSNLDDVGERMLMVALMKLKQRGTTVIAVTHRPSLLNIADKVLVLRSGQVMLFGPRQTVLEKLMEQQKQYAQSR